MIKITLKGDVVKEYEQGITAYEVAKDISMGLAKAACAVRINGQNADLRTELTEDCNLEILTFDDEYGKWAFRHTASHILAQAVKRLYPDVKLAIGPAVDDGFYYDFDIENKFTPDDLLKIEAEMKKIVKEDLKLERFVLPQAEAVEKFKAENEPYKVELAEGIPAGEEVSFYSQGDFTDLCAGAHLMSTGLVKAFKLTSATGAYWRGDSSKKMLCRVYGTAFPKASMLEEHLTMLEEAKKRDHNKLGRELELFTTVDVIGQGLPVMLPKGAKIIQILQRFVVDEGA
jgi:threonyl-tRNA synthetase